MTDKVTSDTRLAVIRRDGYGCVAPRLGAADTCRDRWNKPLLRAYSISDLTLDHVKDEPRMGKRAPSDMEHLVTLCWHHHLNGWATAHRPQLREYIRQANTQWALDEGIFI